MTSDRFLTKKQDRRLQSRTISLREINVLDQGRIVAKGSYDEMIERSVAIRALARVDPPLKRGVV